MTVEPTGLPEFSDFALSAPVLKALADVGYSVPTPIQAQTIPVLLEGRDLLGQAQTGTGKTAAFALPLLTRLDVKRREPQVLVLTPTRELAIQVAEAFQRYGSHMKKASVLAVYGGQDYRIQLKQLKLGVHIIVGTPGRVMDHIRRGKLNLGALDCVVLDEADEMLRMGFIDDVEWILGHTPEKRQITLFSATLPDPIRRIAQHHLQDPAEITIEKKTVILEAIHQRCWMTAEAHKLDALCRILETEEVDGMIVFVRTKDLTLELARKLKSRGYECEPLNGDIAQENREKTVNRLRQGKFDILVATDVAARGLDVTRISHVINFNVPYDAEAYIHRIGRTGRAGRTGEAISFITPREKNCLFMIERATGQKIDKMKMPSAAEVNAHRLARFTHRVTEALKTQDLSLFKELLQKYCDEQPADPMDVAAALAYLAQGEKPLLMTHEPTAVKTLKEGKIKEPRFNPVIRQRHLPEGMERFRIEVGRDHRVRIGQIIEVLAREAGMDTEFIGQIDLYDDFTLVDMPEGMPREVFKALKKVELSGRSLRISRVPASTKSDKRKPMRKSKPKHKDKRK